MTIQFNSRQCPGSIVVTKDKKTLGIITIIRKDIGDFKEGDRYFIPLPDGTTPVPFLKASTYSEIKQLVISHYDQPQQGNQTC